MQWLWGYVPNAYGGEPVGLKAHLRRTVSDLEGANKTVISYATTVRNLAKYMIEDVQNNRSCMNTMQSAADTLHSAVEKRAFVIKSLEVLLEIAIPNTITGSLQLRHDALVRITGNSAARCK